jgi:hypothetical protein
MSTIARLGEAGAKLLLRLVETDGASGSIAHTCSEAGISRASYYRARQQLIALGFLDGNGNLLRFRGQVERPLEVSEEEVVEVTLRARAMGVDLLPWSGDALELMKVGSQAQKRKRQQTALLQEIVKTITGRTISAEEAKKILTQTGESAEAALDLVEEMQRRIVERGTKVDYPGSYLFTMASNKQKEAKPITSQRRVLPTTPAPPSEFAAPTADPEYHDTKSERRRERLRASGDAIDTGWD